MPKNIFYAMDENHLRKYSDFKDMISLKSSDLSPDKIKEISIMLKESRSDSRELYFMDEEGSAHINVTGPLEPKPDPCAIMFDIEMTTYRDIILATDSAEADDDIKKIIYHFDSPGGNVVGLFATADRIRNAKKETLAINHGLMASAAYALASQCDSIECENISDETGSIGVVTEINDYSKKNEAGGIKRYIITSKNAENKRPDVTTEEGRDKIVSRMTELESVFVEYVASGRKITTEEVLNNFGRGGILIARTALSVGMIDKIQSDIGEQQNTTAIEIEKPHEEGVSSMEMTAEEIQKLVNDTASKTRLELSAEFEKKEKEKEKESARKAGFSSLLNKYPSQAAMINSEMAKEGSIASADFAILVQDAEETRIKAEKEQNNNSNNNPGAADNATNPGEEKDNSGNALASALGVKIKGV